MTQKDLCLILKARGRRPRREKHEDCTTSGVDAGYPGQHVSLRKEQLLPKALIQHMFASWHNTCTLRFKHLNKCL